MPLTKRKLLEKLAAIDCQQLAEMYCASSEDPEAQGIIEEYLLKQCHEKLVARARRKLSPDTDTAEEIAQDAVVKIIEELPELCGRAPMHFHGWMYTILDNRITDHWRRQERRRKYLEQAKHESGSVPSLDPELDKVDRIALWEAVQQLRPDRRRIVEDYLAGWEVKDIAEDHNLPPDEVSRILYRAKQDLKDILH